MTPERLPPLLASGLRVVFVGTEPGPMSLRLGEYYADATNRFYQHLALTKFTPRRLSAADCWRLPDYGIGLDDVYDDPEGLRSSMEAVTPRAICFNSGGALSRIVDPRPVGRLWRGQPLPSTQSLTCWSGRQAIARGKRTNTGRNA